MLISKPGWDFGHWEHYGILGNPSHWSFLNCEVPNNLTIPWREEERYWNGGETLDITLQKPNWGCKVSLVKGPSVILKLSSQFFKMSEGLVTMIAEPIRLHIQQQTLWHRMILIGFCRFRWPQNCPKPRHILSSQNWIQIMTQSTPIMAFAAIQFSAPECRPLETKKREGRPKQS